MFRLSGTLKQMIWSAAGTVSGAVIGGPVGAMVGGGTGCVVGYTLSDDYQSLIHSLEDLSDQDKSELVNRVKDLVKAATTEELATFISDEAHRTSLLKLLKAASLEFIAKGG